MGIGSWATICAVCLTGAASPGPSLAVVVKNTVAGGRRQGVQTAVGHGLGVGLYALAAVVGVAGLVAASPRLSTALEIVGGAYLAWLGFTALRNRHRSDASPARTEDGSGFREGFSIAFLNPKIAVFFLALLGSFLPADATAWQRAGVACVAMVIDAGWYVLVAILLVVTGAAEWLARHRSAIDLVLGVLLIGVGGFLAVGGTLSLAGG